MVVEAGLQAWGDAVGALVVLLDPSSTLAVLNADGSDACGDTEREEPPWGMGGGSPIAPMGAPYLPRPLPAAPPAEWLLSWCPRFQSTGPRGGCADLARGRGCAECPVPAPASPQPKAAAPHGLTGRDGIGADLHHLLPARVVGVGLCHRLHTEVPGFADGQEAFLQHSGSGRAWGRARHCQTPPQGQEAGTLGSPMSLLTQDEAHGIDTGHHVNGVSLEGLQQVSHTVLQALGREQRCWVPTAPVPASMGMAGCPSSPIEVQPTPAPSWVPPPLGAGYLRVAVEPGGVQPGIVGTLDVGGHQRQVPALLLVGRDVAQVHVWAPQALRALSMQQGGDPAPTDPMGLPTAQSPPWPPLQLLMGTPRSQRAPYLRAGGEAEPMAPSWAVS